MFRTLALVAALVVFGLPPEDATAQPEHRWPVCDRMPALHSSPPAGAVIVEAGGEQLWHQTARRPAGTTFWLRPGSHTLGDHEDDQVRPKRGNVYLGAPGAVLDGQGRNRYAFTGDAADVVIRGLTVRNFAAPRDEGVVNTDSAEGWVIEHNTVQHNQGAALMAGARQRVLGNCLRANGQYGMNADAGAGLTDLVVEGNEITGNNTADWEARTPGCGCTGGLRFRTVDGADVRHNWVHDNRGPGLWANTNSNDFLVEHNLFEDNDAAALTYETSYNAVIRDNTFRRNTIVLGRTVSAQGDDRPVGTLQLSEAGGEPRVPARTDKIEVRDNTFQDNWAGITLWEDANRFCNSPAATAFGACTKLVTDRTRCTRPGIWHEPLIDDCRWKTQRVEIHRNRFTVDPVAFGCTERCARMAVLSNRGGYPAWSPYQGDAVRWAITFEQDNVWHHNTYVGPWTFTPFAASRVLAAAAWQSAPYHQDTCSALSLLPTTC